MADYTITLTDTEVKSMEYITADVDEWITNAAQNRARIAKEQIIALLVSHCNKNSIAIETGEDDDSSSLYFRIVSKEKQAVAKHLII